MFLNAKLNVTELHKNSNILQELYMKSNRLSQIANDTFDELTNLEVLDISLNQITELHREWFLNKPNLRVVSEMYQLIKIKLG